MFHVCHQNYCELNHLKMKMAQLLFKIDIMKNSSPLNLKFTLFAMSKPKQQFFSAELTALSAQLRVNQNKRNNQNNCEKVKFDKDLN